MGVILVQISDLHIGYGFLEAVFSKQPGWRAHDPLLCFALETALADLVALHPISSDQLFFLMTGDLTRYGLPSEFCVGHTYLLSDIVCNRSAGRAVRCGLNIPEDRLRMIPGNHDQWNKEMWGVDSIPWLGSVPGIQRVPLTFIPQGHDPTVETLHFPQSQWPTTITSPDGSFKIDLFGIDSSSGFERGESNLLARGDISERQIVQLRRDIHSASNSIPTVRCVLCHHSLCYSNDVSGQSFLDGIRPHVMSDESKRRLLTIATDDARPVHVFLTGHTHSFASKGVVDEGSIPFEFRCGTTLQAPATDGHQGFWAHEVRLQDGVIDWTSYRYQWDGTRFNRLNDPWINLQVLDP